ncbi:MAG: glycosyltransferase family 2 protein [Planctomycetota bacterium]
MVSDTHQPAARPYDLAIVAPALNEAGNLTPLVEEVFAVFADTPWRVQVVVVDDGSTDATPAELAALAQRFPALTVRRHDTSAGQSAALATGIAAAHAPLIATLDADLQNDPGDLPQMLTLLHDRRADLVQGDRSANRRDHLMRRMASGVGRLARRLVVGDAVRDTGCATRVLRTDFARRLPLHRPGMHRFIPALVAGFGGVVVETPVHHRPRAAGQTKYGTGLLKRGLPGLRDCFVVRAMVRDSARQRAGALPA